MKNISLKTVVISIIMLVIVSIANVVNAAETAITLTTSEDVKLKAGETITVSINIANGYEGFQGKLEYDTSVFESASIEKYGNWNVDMTNNKIVIDRATAASGTEKVATLTLKVKSSITAESTKVTISNVKASKDGATITANNAEKTIGTEGVKEEEKSNTQVSNNDKQNVPANSEKNTAKNNIQSSKTNAKRILNAGDTTTIAIISVIAIVAVVGCLGFIKYARNKDIK